MCSYSLSSSSSPLFLSCSLLPLSYSFRIPLLPLSYSLPLSLILFFLSLTLSSSSSPVSLLPLSYSLLPLSYSSSSPHGPTTRKKSKKTETLNCSSGKTNNHDLFGFFFSPQEEVAHFFEKKSFVRFSFLLFAIQDEKSGAMPLWPHFFTLNSKK